jgi:hypothetical protein
MFCWWLSRTGAGYLVLTIGQKAIVYYMAVSMFIQAVATARIHLPKT